MLNIEAMISLADTFPPVERVLLKEIKRMRSVLAETKENIKRMNFELDLHKEAEISVSTHIQALITHLERISEKE